MFKISETESLLSCNAPSINCTPKDPETCRVAILGGRRIAVMRMTRFRLLGEAATELERAARKATELAELCDLCAIYLSHPDLQQLAFDVKSAACERLAEIERLFLAS